MWFDSNEFPRSGKSAGLYSKGEFESDSQR